MVRRPRVAILSTGDEIVAPGDAIRPGLVYDSNGRILADAVREIGGDPEFLGAFRDDVGAVRAALADALARADLVLLSGGTSKGEGDLNQRVVAELDPGVVVHGVALKPGKPICLAAAGTAARRGAAGLPDLGRLHVPRVRRAGDPLARGPAPEGRETRRARLAQKTISERGRARVPARRPRRRTNRAAPRAYPMGKGSGSVTAFSRADGFVRIGRSTEIVEADERGRGDARSAATSRSPTSS